MLAAWYERPGPAADVLHVGEMADPVPGPGEVRVRLTFSGINPGDTKKRGDWVYGAQSYRAFGTAAQLTAVPADQAVALPDQVGDEIGACLGIPGITAHRAVFGDGSVAGATVLVHGVLGGVGSMAAQLAAWNGAAVIGTVRRSSDLEEIDDAVTHRVALDAADPIAEIRRAAPDGVHRIVEVSFSDNADLDAAVAAPEAVIAAYA